MSEEIAVARDEVIFTLIKEQPGIPPLYMEFKEKR
jgi:hypothetical protein